MELIKWIFAFIGHLGTWCVAYNLTHSTAWPRKTRKLAEKVIFLLVVVPIVYVSMSLIQWKRFGFAAGLTELFESSKQFPFGSLGIIYVWICIWTGVFFTIRWIYRNSP